MKKKPFTKRGMAARVFSLALCLAMALSMAPVAMAAQAQPAVSKNLDKHSYSTYHANTINSYLYENSSGGLTRVEYINGQVVVEDYDSSFQCQSSRTIPVELPLWGGFYAGKDHNFLIFGQENPSESDSVEVVRVVKYDKSWNRLGQASLYGANTTVPFRSTSLRCVEGGGYLYIRTAHQMYKSDDGLNHQASMMLVVRQGDMEITDSYYKVGGGGYVSHSFNQFILVDKQGRIVSLDHGDAYPRALLLQQYNTKAGSSSFDWREEELELVTFPGATGANNTGCSVGGFAETSNGYVAAYSYDGKGANYNRDLYVDFISENLSASSTKITSGVYSFTPVLASTGLDGGYVMWQNPTVSNDPLGKELYYIRYDANGEVGERQTATAALSDCAPINWNGKLVWYVTNNSAPVFYTLDSSGITSCAANGSGSPGQTAPSTPSTPTTPITPSTPTTPTTPSAPNTGTAYANTQTILLDGKSVTLQAYALKDSSGGLTNYVKLRDMAWYLNGTQAQFWVGWDQSGIYLTTHWRYTPNGSELSTPFSGDRAYREGTGKTYVDTKAQELSSIVLTDDQGGDYTYFKLRDLGRYLGFNVSYINGQVVVNSSEPYSDAQ